ncbi:MAG: hypothetical protein RR319_00270 [Bacteroides sp.]
MKKMLICMALLLCAVGANAQFEKNKWVVAPAVTGLNLSYDGQQKTRFGFGVNAGAFLANNVALLIDLEGDYGKNMKATTALGVGGRYYMEKMGLFFGLGLKYKHFAFEEWKDNDFGMGAEIGYAFFLSRTVTIEPSVYYDQSFTNHKDYSKVGLKLGFGFYF